MKAHEKKVRATAIGVRKDIVKKMGFGVEYASAQLMIGFVSSARGKVLLHNFYVPPAGSMHHNPDAVARLSECDENSFIGGDFNWFGSGGMRGLRAGQGCDDQGKVGKKYINQRDKVIWASWPRGGRTLAPRRGDNSTWTARRCWRTGTRSICDYIIVPRWVSTPERVHRSCAATWCIATTT